MLNDTYTYRRAKKTLFFVVVAVVCIAGVVTIFASRDAIARQMSAWKLVPQPDQLTELYFTSPTELPSTYLPGATQEVSFTVHNLEHQPMLYSYEIIQQNDVGAVSYVLAIGSFRLKHDGYHTETTTATYLDTGQKARIIVRLINQGQTVHYWVVKGGES